MSWLSTQMASIPFQALYLFVAALFISAGGFYRVVYFISIGYAFSITGMALITAGLFSTQLTWVAVLHCLFLALYGLRLGTYLISRERNPSFAKEIQATHERSAHVKLPIRVAIWLSVSLLYVLMFSPGLFHLTTPVESMHFGSSLAALPGLAIMAGGLLLESLADRQKAAYKSAHPDRFCDVGLYKVVRCPNYLGEVIFWIGNFLAGIPFYTTAGRAVFSLAGLVCITLIMMGSTKRLENTQDKRYGSREDYQRYITSVPVLFPFLPIYSLKNVKVYLE